MCHSLRCRSKLISDLDTIIVVLILQLEVPWGGISSLTQDRTVHWTNCRLGIFFSSGVSVNGPNFDTFRNAPYKPFISTTVKFFRRDAKYGEELIQEPKARFDGYVKFSWLSVSPIWRRISLSFRLSWSPTNNTFITRGIRTWLRSFPLTR